MFSSYIKNKVIFFSFILIILFTLVNDINAEDSHKIVLLVNDDVITSYDIVQRMKVVSIIMEIEINDVNRLSIQNQIIDELINEKIQNEKINEYNIYTSEEEVDEYELSYFKRFGKTREKIYEVFQRFDINQEIVREMISTQISWNKLISGLFYRLISVSENEIEEMISLDSSITNDQAFNTIRDRQITLKANKYLRDLKDSSTIEYR